jgi:broad specificity phosphatase PhoE
LKEYDLPGRITFISHASTAAVCEATFPLDEAIGPREFARLQATGWTPPRARKIYVAPEQRTRQTAEAFGLDVLISEELRDLDYNFWRGKSLDEVQEIDPEGIGLWLTDPDASPHGGESIMKLLGRIEGWLGQQEPGHTLAITHPAVIRAAVVIALDAPAYSFWRIEIPPASLTDLRWNGRSWTLRSCGCRLSGDGSGEPPE